MPVEILGLLGLTMIVVAWIPETIKSLKSGQTAKIEFLILYLLGSIFLTVYAILRADIVFTILNGLAVLFSGLNVVKYFLVKNQ